MKSFLAIYLTCSLLVLSACSKKPEAPRPLPAAEAPKQEPAKSTEKQVAAEMTPTAVAAATPLISNEAEKPDIYSNPALIPIDVDKWDIRFVRGKYKALKADVVDSKTGQSVECNNNTASDNFRESCIGAEVTGTAVVSGRNPSASLVRLTVDHNNQTFLIPGVPEDVVAKLPIFSRVHFKGKITDAALNDSGRLALEKRQSGRSTVLDEVGFALAGEVDEEGVQLDRIYRMTRMCVDDFSLNANYGRDDPSSWTDPKVLYAAFSEKDLYGTIVVEAGQLTLRCAAGEDGVMEPQSIRKGTWMKDAFLPWAKAKPRAELATEITNYNRQYESTKRYIVDNKESALTALALAKKWLQAESIPNQAVRSEVAECVGLLNDANNNPSDPSSFLTMARSRCNWAIQLACSIEAPKTADGQKACSDFNKIKQ